MQKALLIVVSAVGASAKCLHTGMQYNDFSGLNLTSLANQDFTTDTPQACQEECQRVDACKYFTWWNNTHDCFLDTSDSTYSGNSWAGVDIATDNMGYADPVAGPKECPFEMPLWGWILIGLGVLAVIAAVVFLLTKKKEAPKKKTRALPKPKPEPVPTETEPVPTYTSVIYQNQPQPVYAMPQPVYTVPQMQTVQRVMAAPVPTYAAPATTVIYG